MPVMSVILDEPAWPDLGGPGPNGIAENVIWLGAGAPPIQIAALEQGMTGGAPSVAIRFDLPDGRIVVAETSLKLFQAANAILLGKFGIAL